MKKLLETYSFDLLIIVLVVLSVYLLIGTVSNKRKADALAARITELKTQQSENRDFCENAEAICQQALELCKSDE